MWNLNPGAGPVGAELYFGNPFPPGNISQLVPAPDGNGFIAGCSNCTSLFKVEPSLVPPAVQSAGLGQSSTGLARSPDGRLLWVAESDTSGSLGGIRMFSLSEATTIDLVVGAGQSALAGGALPLPIQVGARDAAGRPQEGVVVTFQLLGADPGTLDGMSVQMVRRITDVNGQAFAKWTMGGTLGPAALQIVALGVADSLTVAAEVVGTDADIVPQAILLGPADGATAVNAGTAVFARFNQRMNTADVVNRMSVRLASGPAAGRFSFEGEGRTIIFQPSRALPFSTPCTLLVAAGARDLEGQETAAAAMSVFTTESMPTVSLNAISPPAATVGTPVAIEGEGFSPIAVQNVVIFNGRIAPVVLATTTSLVTSVPIGVTSGPVTVIVGASTSNALDFVVLPPNPVPGEPIATVPAGKALSDIAITPDGLRAYVTSPTTNSVNVLEIAATAFVGRIGVGLQPQGIAMLPDGSRAYVANTGSDALSVIDTDPASPTYHAVVGTVAVGDGPVDVVASAVGPKVYVANAGSGTVSIVDAKADNGTYNQVVTTVNTGSGCSAVTISSDGTRMYAGTSGGVVMVDLGSLVVTTVNTGSGCSALTISPDATIVLALLDDGRLVVIDATPGSASFNRVVTTVNTGSGASAVTVSPDATLAYVTSADGNVVLVYQIVKVNAGGPVSIVPGPAVTLTLVATIPVGDGPADVAVDPNGNLFALVANEGSGTVTIIGLQLSIPMGLDLAPESLSPSSTGRWVTAYLEPPPPFLPTEIKTDGLRLNGLVAPDPAAPTSIGDHDSDGHPDLMLKFDRRALQLILPTGEKVPVEATGAIGPRTFSGDASLKVKVGKVTHPQAGEIVSPLEPFTVRWEVPPGPRAPRVAILTSLDRGKSWRSGAEQDHKAGRAVWTPPSVQADSVKVAVVEIEASDGDQSGRVLGVSDYFRLLAPVAAEPLPLRLEFSPIRPTPSLGVARLRYGLSRPGRVDLALYDIQGRRLATLVAGDQEAGWHEMAWEGRIDAGGSAGAGLYFARLRAEGREFMRRLIWIR